MIFLCSSASVLKTCNLDDITFSNYSEMTYKKMDSLLPLLKPNHFLMFISTPKLSNECVKKCVEDLKWGPGKVALVLSKETASEFEYLLNHLTNRRLDILVCVSDLLAELGAPLKIGHCVSSSIVNRAQFRKILCHNIESLQVEIDENFVVNLNERASRKSSKQSVCDSLKKLKVSCGMNYESLMSLLDDVKVRCPNLKMLDIEIILSQDNILGVMPVFHADELLDHVLTAQENIREILGKCRPMVPRLKVSSLLRLFYLPADELSCDWINRARTLDLFRISDHQDVIEQEDQFSTKLCQLTSKFDDGFLQLEHVTEVGCSIPE